MIGNANWFHRRQYSGWGLMPKTWEGFAYIGVMVGSVWLVGQMFPETIAFAFTVLLVTIFVIDILHIMSQVRLDERERAAEALAERNAAWAMVAALALALGYVNYYFEFELQQKIMPVLITILIAGLIAKAATAWYLKRKGF